MPNKVFYGFSHVYYATATIDSDGGATYGAPKALLGGRGISLQKSGSQNKYYADNIPFFTYNEEAGTYSGDLEMTLLSDDFLKDCVGMKLDANNRLYEDANSEPPHFALLFQFEGDVAGIRHVFYNCTCTTPDIASQTTEGTNEPKTETVTITATPAYFSALGKYIPRMKAVEGDTGYSTWFTSVVTPAASTT